jgi:hypothetical protein
VAAKAQEAKSETASMGLNMAVNKRDKFGLALGGLLLWRE